MRMRNKYPAVLALTSVAILGGGMLLKPARQVDKPALSETEMARLQRLAQRKTLQDMAAFFTAAADEAAASVVHWKGAASGLVWNPHGRIVSVPLSETLPNKAEVLGPAGRSYTGRVALVASGLSIAAVDTPVISGVQPATRAASASAEPGTWVVQVARRADGGRQFTPAVITGVTSARCGDFPYRQLETSVPPSEAMLGGGIFDMDNRVLAIVSRCGARLAAVSAADVDKLLAEARAPESGVLAQYGLRAAPDVGSAAGLVVTEVRLDMAAGEAGLAPGDRIAKADGENLASLQELEGHLAANTGELRLDIRRRGKRLQIALAPPGTPRPGGPISAGMVLERPAGGVLIERVLPGSAAGRSGVRVGDRLLSVDGRAVTSVAMGRRLLERPGRNRYVVFRRGAREWGTVLSDE